MALFQSSVVKKYSKAINPTELKTKWELFSLYFHNPIIQENIRNSKEEEFQEGFLRELFVKILGYTINPEPNFNLKTEQKNIKDSKKADGAIVINEVVKAVIELKGTETTDLSKVETQAFGYKNNQPECLYIISSNFEKLRFYIDNAIEHLEFNLFKLTEQEFELLYLCLAFEQIRKDIPKKIKDESVSQEDLITKKLYNDYSLFKRELHQNLVELNPQFEPLELFKKSQKLLDRFLFLFFAEDRQLLPPNSVRLILNDWKDLQERDEDIPLYNRFKKYFEYLNTGYKGKRYDVFAYNGGLFKPDELLDAVKIDNNLLYKHTFKLSEYDFASEVDVNILGHIFENSLNELDEIKAQLEGQVIDKSKTKRKKDGVFYTPKYITKYIVENTVGKLCLEKKAELDIKEEYFITDKKRPLKTKQALLTKLTDYRNWLLHLTICDPACGSGAFLNQALDFLIAEHRTIDELQAKLFGDAIVLSDIEKSILENNLFGVDLNEESVEIAKLSLWLRTAQPNRKLNDLNNNIKCGNSLIDDSSVAGEKAFKWEEEFPQIFAKGGFDAIIGNPPWGAKLDFPTEQVLLKKYPVVPSKLKDSYMYFMLLCIDLLKDNSNYGLIVPNTWLLINNTSDFRATLLKYDILEITDHGDGVFQDAIVESATIFIKKRYTKDGKVLSRKYQKGKLRLNHMIDKKMWLEDDLNRIVLELDNFDYSLIKKMEAVSDRFENSSDIIFGIKPYQVGHGKPPQTREIVENRIYHSDFQINDEWKPLVTGTDVNKYSLKFNRDAYIKYGEWLMYSSNQEKILSKKILLRRTSSDLRAVIDENNYYPQNSLFIITSEKSLGYITGLLNSKLFDKIYKAKCPQVGKVFAEVKPSIIKSLPIAKADKNQELNIGNKVIQLQEYLYELSEIGGQLIKLILSKYEIEKLTTKLQNWHELEFGEFLKELQKAKVQLSLSQEAEWMQYFNEQKQKAQTLKAEIDKTDKEIDNMVYELYGLTEEEIKIVEGLNN